MLEIVQFVHQTPLHFTYELINDDDDDYNNSVSEKWNALSEDCIICIRDHARKQFFYRAMQCKARYCDCLSSVCPSVRDVGVSGPHRLEILETNIVRTISPTPSLSLSS